MAAYSYQPHHFLLNSTFLSNTHFDISAFSNSNNNMMTASEFLPMEVVHHEGFSDAVGVYNYQSSYTHDQSSKMHSAGSSIDMDQKVEEIGEQFMSHNLINNNCGSDKQKKSRKVSSLTTTQCKLIRKVQGKGKKEKKCQTDEEKKKIKKAKANKTNLKECCEDTQKDYIHVRARRGQATDSHSLAERVRRERISERMKMLQALVPGCEKVTGKALMLDEIINYVQSLQNQIEFLSMELASFNPIYSNFAMDLDTALLKQERLSTLAPSQPSGSSSQLCSPTAVNYNNSTTNFTTTTPTLAFHPLIESSLLLQQEAAENLAWEQMDTQTQNFINQSGLGNDNNNNNMCSFQ